MQNAISVQGLGKKYVLRHMGQGPRYIALRDVLAQKVGALFRRPPAESATREEFWALKDVSFDIRQGEAVGIIGRNGAGKSTLLKLLSRITKPTRGRIEINGRVASLLEVGTGFHPELTGRENIYLNGAIMGMARGEIRRKFDEIVAFAEVEKFLDTPVKRYSSGMYMRLAFAVAAHLEPEILIVDEVLAVGDAEFQKKCLGKMEQVTSSGRTIIFVSHQINAVENLCSRVFWMEGGKLKADSSEVRAVTSEYLFGSQKEGGLETARWNNDGQRFRNPFFHPYSFYLGNSRGEPVAMPVANDEEIWVHLEGRIEQLDPALTIGYAIYTESGELLYWSYQTDSDPREWPVLAQGDITLRSPISEHFMNEGRYRIELIGGLHHRQWLFEPGTGVPEISFIIQGGLSKSPLWQEKRPGLLAPVMFWKSNL
jgi:lipopolysaccharide transport system ATP-binding protein